MKYSVLLFDLDQTLLDTDLNAEKALKKLQLPFKFDFTTERVQHWHQCQREMWADLEKGNLTREELMETRFQYYFNDFDIAVDSHELEQQFEQAFFAEHALMPHAKELLEELHGDFELDIISNGTHAKQDRILRDADITKYFDKMYLAESVGYSKPDPLFFKKVMADLKPYEKSQMLVIGDSLTADIQGANNAKIDSIWFNPQKISESDIHSTYEVNDLAQIKDVLRNS